MHSLQTGELSSLRDPSPPVPVILLTFLLSSWELLLGIDRILCPTGGTRCQPPRTKHGGTLGKARSEGEERRNRVRAGFNILAVAGRQVDGDRHDGLQVTNVTTLASWLGNYPSSSQPVITGT